MVQRSTIGWIGGKVVSLDVVGRFANGVINDVVVASNLFVIAETDLDVPVSEELVGAGRAGGIDAWVLGKDCLVKKKKKKTSQ
jgi:hypothetical protein